MPTLEPLLTSADYLAGRCGAFDGETTCGLPRGHVTALGQPRAHRFHAPSEPFQRWIDKDDEGNEVARGPLTLARWMADSPLRRQQHPFRGEGVERDNGAPAARDRCASCGLIRAAYSHHDSEQAAGRDWQTACVDQREVGLLPPDESPEATMGGILGPRPAVAAPPAARDCCNSVRYQPHIPGCFGSRAPDAQAFVDTPITAPRGGVQYGQPARSRPPSCGAMMPTMLRQPGMPALCALEVGHAGMHRAAEGTEWTVAVTDRSPRCSPACSEGHTYRLGCELQSPARCGCDSGCSLCRRCDRCGSDTCPATPDDLGRADPTACTAIVDGRVAAVEAAAKMRVGRRVGRTLYLQVGPTPSDDDVLIGLMDTPELAALVARAWNLR